MIHWQHTFTGNSTSTQTSGGVHVQVFIPAARPRIDPARVEQLLAEAGRIYRQHAKTAHPDAGGSEEAMKRLNAEYDEIKRQIRAGGIR